MSGLFISGTDTGVGKTLVATALLRALVARGARAVGMKPVAAGISPGATFNADVGALIAAGNVEASLADVNPFSFAPAIAPHLAAARSGVTIDLGKIAAAYDRLSARADVVIVEGAGGVLVPLSATADMLDVAAQLRLRMVLVVGIRLGCLNHALLSAHAVSARGIMLAGWIANRVDPAMEAADDNIAALAARLPAPLVADIRWCSGAGPGASVAPEALQTLGIR